MRKTKIFVMIVFAVFLLQFTTSCEDSDNDLEVHLVSLQELFNDIIVVNVSNTATGFQTIFTKTVIDSTSRAKHVQSFVDAARFFDDNSGYFFVQTINDAWSIATISHELIGTRRMDAVDVNGKFHTREMVNLITNRGYGFVNYVFPNPATNIDEEKTAFVDDIPASNWYIGAGVYESNYIGESLSQIEADEILLSTITKTMARGLSGILENHYPNESNGIEFLRDFVDYTRFFDNESGYFFIYDFEGNNIAQGANPEMQGNNYWDLQDSAGSYIVREVISIVQNNSEGGFYEYYWNNPATGKDGLKKSFAINIPGTEYFIGTGIYLE